jgi:hypothetical protein
LGTAVTKENGCETSSHFPVHHIGGGRRRAVLAARQSGWPDIGKAKGGVTPGELGQEIAKAIKQKLYAAVNFDDLMKSAGKSLEKAGSAINGLFK